jgi:hypothetical protein
MRVQGSKPNLIRSIFTSQEDYLVFSPRPGLIWDHHLVGRVERELAGFESLGTPWFCLSADGRANDGSEYSAAYFGSEPTLLPDRGRRPVIQTAGTLYAINVSTLHGLRLQRAPASDVVSLINDLIVIAYSRGSASFFTSGFFPCLAERRSLSYVSLEEQLANFTPAALLQPIDAYELFPAEVPRHTLVTEWVEMLSSVLAVKHQFSFVIRTLYRRPHLLRRCLISIEYLRSSLNLFIEIVLASDVNDAVAQSAVCELSAQFPHLPFVIADGRAGKGHSRVRNLIAGLRASRGSRVCIIDDDDYYTPRAVVSFSQACKFGIEHLIIFDTQIIVEKWTSAGVKSHKEIIKYGQLFGAKAWTTTLRGCNSIPLCAIIHPGWFIRQVAEEYAYDFDLSEDFVFHLCCFVHPKRPPVETIDGVGAYLSHRSGEDNVSNVEDRTGWVVDTGNGLYQLLFEVGRTFDVVSGCEISVGEVGACDKVRSLEAELARSSKAHARATEAYARLIRQMTAGRRGSRD